MILHRLWKQWLAAYRRVYNWALEQLKAGFKGDLHKECRANHNFPDWVFDRTYAESLYLVGANGRSPLQMVYNLT
ncbi:MAG: hypothetical protein F6K17_20640, partial [Okeania sp. SIO3C4]|nr:hypothetical protein [Okeania sp. SIO3C4]